MPQIVSLAVILMLMGRAHADEHGQKCHRSPENKTIVHYTNCPFGCCQCDNCHPDKPWYDGEVWARCGSQEWCEASARGWYWIVGTAVGSVFGVTLICVAIDYYSRYGNNPSKVVCGG